MSYFVIAEGSGFLAGAPVEGPIEHEHDALLLADEKQQASYKLFDHFMQASFFRSFYDQCELEETYMRLRRFPDPSVPTPVIYRVMTDVDLEGIM